MDGDPRSVTDERPPRAERVASAPRADRVAVRLLGPPAIEVGGRTASVDTRKALALLAYLVITERPQSRDHVAALLWPEADQAKGRSALRRTLSVLNAALEGRGLSIEREALAFTGEGVDVDVRRFRSLARSADTESWRGAVDAYGGDFMSGFALRDSPEFDDWQLLTADGFRRELSAVLERLTAAAEPGDAVTFAKRWVAIDAMHEPAHRELMRQYLRAGDRSAALRQYRECVAVLEQELGVEPLDETTELYEAIRESRAPAIPAAPVVTSPRDVVDLPFVGRASELASLHATYDAIEHDGALVVIGGEPGIGKTRLAREFLSFVRDRGACAIETRCHPEEEGLAFGTVIELLRAVPDDRRERAPATSLAEAARLVPELGTTAATSLEGPAARRRLLEAIADTVSVVAGDVPGVIFVDDVHATDESSLDALRFLVRRLRERALCVVLTWRTEEVPPGHPLRQMLADAQRDGYATAITLPRLAHDELSELLASSGTQTDLDVVYEQTAGVPFFVAEYLKTGGSEAVPAGVRGLLASRLTGVGRVAGQVLAAAAVLGRAFDPATVRETSGRTEDEVVSALDELTAAGLVAESDDRYDLTHPKLGEYLYEDTTLGRRRLLHRRAATALLRTSRRHPEIAALVAHHLERAGDEEAAGEQFKRAGDHARAVYANAEALAHYRSALALGWPDAPQLHEAIADLLTLRGDYTDAIASYEKAAALGADIAVIGRKLGDVHHRLGDWTSAEAHLIEAEEAIDGGPGRARVLADRSLNAHRADLPEQALELADRALDEARKEDDPRALAQANNVAGILAWHGGDGGRAREHLEASLEFAQRLGDAAAIAAALNNLALALRASGATEEALVHAERALAECRRIGDRHREAAVLSNIGDVLRDLGRADEALRYVMESAKVLADLATSDQPHPEVWKLTEW